MLTATISTPSNRSAAMLWPTPPSSPLPLQEEWRAYWLEYQTAAPEMVDEVEFFEAVQTLGGWYQAFGDHGPMLLCLDRDRADDHLPIALACLAEQGIVAIVTATGRGLARRNQRGSLQDLHIEIAHQVYRMSAGGRGWTVAPLD